MAKLTKGDGRCTEGGGGRGETVFPVQSALHSSGVVVITFFSHQGKDLQQQQFSCLLSWGCLRAVLS